MAEQQPDTETQIKEAAPPVPLHKRIGDPTLALTAVYLLVSLIGALNAVLYYGYFDLNIFNFWEPSDIFLAGFRHPSAFLWAALVFGWFRWGNWDSKRRLAKASHPDPTRSPTWYERVTAFIERKTIVELRAYRADEAAKLVRFQDPLRWGVSQATGFLGVFVMLFWAFSIIGAGQLDESGSRKNVSSLDRVAIVTAEGQALGSLAEGEDPFYLVGTSNRVVIVWDDALNRTLIIPWESIDSMDYRQRPSRDGRLQRLWRSAVEVLSGEGDDG